MSKITDKNQLTLKIPISPHFSWIFILLFIKRQNSEKEKFGMNEERSTKANVRSKSEGNGNKTFSKFLSNDSGSILEGWEKDMSVRENKVPEGSRKK